MLENCIVCHKGKIHAKGKCRKCYDLDRKVYLNNIMINYYHKNPEKVIEKELVHYYKNKNANPNKLRVVWLKARKAYNARPENIAKIEARNIGLKIPLKENCERCGISKSLFRHHSDYSKPNDIVTLCRKCHHKKHREINRKVDKK